MKHFKIVILLVALTVAAAFWAQNSGTADNQNAGTPPSQNGTAPSQNSDTAPNQGQAGNPVAQGNVLRIISPRNGERLRQSYVNVQFELTNNGASAAGTPNYELKLDDRDPVTTSSTSQSFTGLTPGPHTLTVQLVDANGTPVAGARSEVQFVVLQPGPAPTSGVLKLGHGPYLIAAAMRVKDPQEPAPARTDDDDPSLPSSAGALPLLSVVGFGVLLGGIASAMRTRPR